MSTTSELLDLVNRASDALVLPAIVQVFVPPLRAGPGRAGEFCAVRLADGSVGTAFVLLGDALARLNARDSLRVAGQPAQELAQGLGTGDPGARALGLAASNAIAQHVYRSSYYAPAVAANSFGSLELARGDHLGMIGLFKPLIERVQALGVPVTVLELRADLVRQAPGLEVTLDPGRLAACNKIIATSSVLLNDSLDEILAHARHAREFAIIGPSASGFPDPLFSRGVSVVGGYRVSDPLRFMARAVALEPWGDAGSKTALRREDYPGTQTLLTRAASRRTTQ